MLSENARGLVLLQSTRRSAFRPVTDLSRPSTVSEQSRRARDQPLMAYTHRNVLKRASLARNKRFDQSRANDGPEWKLRTGFRDSGWRTRGREHTSHDHTSESATAGAKMRAVEQTAPYVRPSSERGKTARSGSVSRSKQVGVCKARVCPTRVS